MDLNPPARNPGSAPGHEGFSVSLKSAALDQCKRVDQEQCSIPLNFTFVMICLSNMSYKLTEKITATFTYKLKNVT